MDSRSVGHLFVRSVVTAMSASGVVLASLIVVPSAAAQDEEVEDSQSYASLAVQNRRYGSVHEITAFFGVLPLDAFTKGITLSGAYTIHFSELVAWGGRSVHPLFPGGHEPQLGFGGV